jgi:hypothetical protein
MPRLATATAFNRVMGKLLADRKKKLAKATKLMAQVSEIDTMFAEFGISLEGAPVAAPAARKTGRGGRRGGGRKRGVFAVTGEQTVLDYLKKHGKSSTGSINKYWVSEGRGGKADNTLGKLVKAGTLKRVKSEDVRGSLYTFA